MKRLLLVPLLLLLAGCSSNIRVVELGVTPTGEATERAAIQRLSREVQGQPSASKFLVRWSSGSGARSSFSEIAYNKTSRILRLGKIQYSNVEEKTIYNLAAKKDVLSGLSQYSGVTREVLQ